MAGKISFVSSGEAKARYDQFFRADGTKKSGGEGITVQLIKPGVIKLLRQLINL